MVKKILLLGHKGLLGSMVHRYLVTKEYNVIITTYRWDTPEFRKFVVDREPNFIVNCIGAIPQKKRKDYFSVNYELPLWLDSLGIPIIHPHTDDEGGSDYSKSKSMAQTDCVVNTKMIRCSIIGILENDSYSLIGWYLSNPKGAKLNGYTNHYWNGITTYEWAKLCDDYIKNWDTKARVVSYASDVCLSKYDLLIKFGEIFNTDYIIEKVVAPIDINNCLDATYNIGHIGDQLIHMYNFVYNKKSDV